MTKKNPLRGEERKIVSTRVYRSEFANFVRLCQEEDKSVNAKMREMIREEIERNFGDILDEPKQKVQTQKSPKKHADFTFSGMFNFDTSFDDSMLKVEKVRYVKGILPKIEELRKEITKNKKPTKKEKMKNFGFMMTSKSNHRNWTFEYENGEIYPKDIEEPDIRIIQFAEPHILVTDLSDEERDWYNMPNLIRGFADESYLSYQLGLFLSSIASAINCCEYILKYEHLRYLNKTDKPKAEEKSRDKKFSLGSFIHTDNKYLDELKITRFHSFIEYLNNVRISLYHFSPDKEDKATAKGELEVEKHANLSDDMVLPIVAFRIYSIMIELLNHFYGKENALKYIEECVADWMNKRGLKKEDVIKEVKNEI